MADRSNQTSLPILYIKLSSAMEFTWILGFIDPFTEVEFIAYLFVILNSLQGMLRSTWRATCNCTLKSLLPDTDNFK